MGRKKKYVNEDEQIKAKRRWRLEYYYRNKEAINKKDMVEYYKRKKLLKND